MFSVRIQGQPFDVGAEVAALTEGRTDAGAVVTFTGLCRADAGADGAPLAVEDVCEAGIHRHRDGFPSLHPADAAQRQDGLHGVVLAGKFGQESLARQPLPPGLDPQKIEENWSIFEAS